MRGFALMVIGALAVLGGSGSTANAVIRAGDFDRKAMVGNQPIQKVHGWHRYCDWGPVRFHRHVPDIGNVPCYHQGNYRWRRHYWHDRRWHRGHDRFDRPRCMIEPWLCKPQRYRYRGTH